jgi:prepilin-type N-terminal cleavage/methylation domain-containing protein
MSFNNIKRERGFTIVELLIVIVVIGILAAITIVAYNGVQSRAKTTSADAAANSAIKKSELYNTEQSAYPTAPSQLTGAAATTSYQLTGVTFVSTLTSSSAPTALMFISCGSSVGVKIGSYNYTNSSISYSYTGTATSGNCASTTGLTT